VQRNERIKERDVDLVGRNFVLDTFYEDFVQLDVRVAVGDAQGSLPEVRKSQPCSSSCGIA
jgi:hypothetical protein